ncbi:flagellar biosynthesis anti-sigma factor FlgM [Pseudobdellovibrio exovorus]|uniref:Negative regulator of flagellin synthesis n=1 Tax=Pseudobdellovibrio exovorus JSS TaxID=1184267 RepID=M4VNU0_9BACT|nr:flagellar biosynthesis anti-sigma factor FlgM [Pseudobdellovibrio exovorus]AGH94789.1 FlgM, negative regulator of flagellin synthesis [Pseudobdellovibrio exovorus JSS]
MKITHNKVGQNLNLTDAKANKTSDASKTGAAQSAQTNSSSSASAGAQASKVELSPRVQDIKRIKELAASAPDVNAEKVEHFKRLIAEGKYKVDAKAVADRMVEEHLRSAGRTGDE